MKRVRRIFLSALISVGASGAHAPERHALAAARDKTKAAAPAEEKAAPHPSDFIKDFPGIRWGMSQEEARAAVVKATGNRPGGWGKLEVVWNGTFADVEGRATALLEEGRGVQEVAVLVYARERLKEIFDLWNERLSGRHGTKYEVSNTEIDTSHVWRLDDGFAIELRAVKDGLSSVVVIHWINRGRK